MTPREHRGGGNGDETVREVVQYGESPGMFIDKEGYNGGDAKLIYTLVSYNSFTGVKITDMEKDPRSTSYTVFPDKVTYGGTEYEVVGNIVTQKDNGSTFIDAEGDFKLIYTLSGDCVNVSGYSYPDTGSATSVTFPAKITLIGENGNISYRLQQGYYDLSNAPISKLTLIISSGASLYTVPTFSSNSNLQSLKIIVDNDNPASTTSYILFDKIYDCENLVDLVLPNVIGLVSIQECSLGYQATRDNPFILNTKVLFALNLTVNTDIKYLELGQNVIRNTIENAFNYCKNFEVIYNSSPDVTEEDIAKCIVSSGSHNVLLFNNPGGTFTKGATYKTSTNDTTNVTTISDITMPTGTYTFTDSSETEKTVDVAAWSHNSGASWYHAGYEYGTLTPWGSNQNDYSYYYYCMNSFSTVTYKVYYQDSSGTSTIDTQTQTVPCMYNTHLYDKSTYPGNDYVKGILPANPASGGYWDYSTETAGTQTSRYEFGQSVTLTGDIDLCFYTAYNGKLTFTFKWDYVNGTSVTTYSYSISVAHGEGFLPPTEGVFETNATDPSNKNMTSAAKNAFADLKYWIANSGNAYAPSNDTKVNMEGEMTFTAMLSPESYNEVRYWYDSEKKEGRTFIATGDSTASTNIFWKSDSGFFYWHDVDYMFTGFPGSLIHNSDVDVDLYWTPSSNTTVTYHNYNGDGSGRTEYYTAGESTPLMSFTLEGYKLIGWSYMISDSNKGEETYPTGNVNFSPDTEVTMYGSMGLYAIWEKVSGPTVITDNLLVSEENAKEGTYKDKVSHLFISPFTAGDEVRYTVTFYDSTGTSVVDNPSAVGVYVIKVGYQVFRDDDDVTDEYYSGYVKDTPVTYQCYEAFLTIYSGDHSTVTD